MTLNTRSAILSLPLKEMDGSLLTFAILAHVDGWEGEDRVRSALELASLVHRGATRANRGVMPRDHYITHPLRNTLRLLRWGVNDINVLVASILHDTVEDAAEEMLVRSGLSVPASYSERVALVLSGVITPRFGTKVAEILKGVTNPETDKTLSKSERHVAYREHVLESIRSSTEVLLVKLSDLVDNAGSLHHNVEDSPSMVESLASKYFPLLEPLRAEVVRRKPLRPDAMVDVLNQLDRMEKRVRGLLKKG